ncbi:MAG: ornithine cyclodeaminase family protein [Candidatus Bathycorpusculaceae bacterium]
MLFLSDCDIQRLLTMREAIEVVEEAFRELQRGEAIIPERTTIMLRNGSISQMSAYLKKMNVAITKVFGIFPKNAEFNLPTTVATLLFYDLETGKVTTVIDAVYLTALRTGAVSGIATKYLSRKDSKNVGIIGCGMQGRTQLSAVREVRKIEKVFAFDKLPGAKKTFAEEMSKKLGIDVIPVDSARYAVKDADIVITATTSTEPVIKGEWLSEGVHINAIGSYYPNTRELDTETIVKSKLVVDLKKAALKEAGDIILPINEGAITKKHIYAELGEIVTGKKPGRVNDDEKTVFKSVGLAIQDAAVARRIVDNLKTFF